MKEISCLEKIQLIYPQFTKAERKVADVVIQKPRKVIYMSITELADASGVGYTTVFRFCKTLKMDGYQDFKTKLSLGLQAEDIDVDSNLENQSENESGDSFVKTSKETLDKITNVLEVTYRQLSSTNFQKMVDCLIHAPHIYMYGVGVSSSIAGVGTSRFLRIFPRTFHFHDIQDQTISAALLRPDDVAILISDSENCSDILKVAKVAQTTGSHIISISRTSNSTVAKFAEFEIVSCDYSSEQFSSPVISGITQLYILELIFNECYKRRFEISSIFEKRTEIALAEKDSDYDQ